MGSDEDWGLRTGDWGLGSGMDVSYIKLTHRQTATESANASAGGVGGEEC